MENAGYSMDARSPYQPSYRMQHRFRPLKLKLQTAFTILVLITSLLAPPPLSQSYCVTMTSSILCTIMLDDSH